MYMHSTQKSMLPNGIFRKTKVRVRPCHFFLIFQIVQKHRNINLKTIS
jgi:hypothetical protein